MRGRDNEVARRLFAAFPVEAFWKMVPVAFQMTTLRGLETEKAQQFLKIEFAKFNLHLPEAEPIILSPTPVCERRTFAPRKPKTILDFCK